jgi:subtilisin family serine protease
MEKAGSSKKSITGKGIKVGMIDTGIDDQHGDFSPTGVGENSKIRVAINIAEAGEKAGDLPFYPHGTHVGGIIAGNNPRYEEKKGLAPESTLYVYRVFSKKGIVQLSDILGGIEQAIIDRVDVVNLSIGFSSSNPISSNPQEIPFLMLLKEELIKE